MLPTAAAEREAALSLTPFSRCASLPAETKKFGERVPLCRRSPPRWRRICLRRYHDKSATANRIRPYQRTTPQITSTGRTPLSPRPWYRILADLALHKDRGRAALKVDLCVRRL